MFFLFSYWSGDESGPYIQENETSSQEGTPQISDNVETVGPTTQETVEPPDPVDTRSPGGNLVTFHFCFIFSSFCFNVMSW